MNIKKVLVEYTQLAREFTELSVNADSPKEYAPIKARKQELRNRLSELREIIDTFHEVELDRDDEPEIPTMVTIREAATKTRLSYDYIRKLCIQGKVVHVRAGSKFLINMEKFVDFLNQGEQEAIR